MQTTKPAVTVSNGDLFSTRPGTLAGRYLRQYWQPVMRSQDLVPGRARPTRIMHEELTVYRGEGGQAHIVQGRCPHRATRLSTGWVEGDDIRCRYHGWKYAADGRCVEQPGEDATFAGKVAARSYPVTEYLDLIFAYFGEDDPPPFRRFPDFEREGTVEVGPVELWPCNYFNRIDNATDIGHVSYTHRESITRAGLTWWLTNRNLSAEETEYGVRTAETIPGRPPTFYHFHMPNANQVRSRARIEGSREDAASLWCDRLFFRVPVDDDRCISFVIDYMPLTGKAKEAYLTRRREARDVGLGALNDVAENVLAGDARIEDIDPDLSAYKLFWIEDYACQVGQEPISDERSEKLGKMDVGVILTRKLWRRELQALADGEPLKRWRTPAGLAEMSVETT